MQRRVGGKEKGEKVKKSNKKKAEVPWESVWWDWSRVSLVRKAPLAPSLSKYSRHWINIGHPPPPEPFCLYACHPPVCPSGRLVWAAGGGRGRCMDVWQSRHVQIHFGSSQTFALIGAHAQGLCGHAETEEQIDASAVLRASKQEKCFWLFVFLGRIVFEYNVMSISTLKCMGVFPNNAIDLLRVLSFTVTEHRSKQYNQMKQNSLLICHLRKQLITTQI